MANVKPIPDGYHTVTPYLVCRGAAKAIEFYKKAFGAEEKFRMQMPGSDTLGHAEIKIGDSFVMLGDESPQSGCKSPQTLGGTPAGMFLYVKDVDASFKRAVTAGCTAKMQPEEMFWGDRFAKVVDPFGHEWSMATHVKDVTPQEVAKGAAEFHAKMAQQKKA